MNNDIITIDTGVSESIHYNYQPYSLVNDNDPILKEVIPVYDFTDDTDEISKRIIKTLEQNKGFGLAAPQCGLRYNMFVMGAEGDYTVMINPKITYKSDNQTHMPEGCLSFPFLVLSITRPETIKVKFQDVKGNEHENEYTGLTARIIQHEIDHLSGITFDTVCKPLALKNALKKREKKTKLFARTMMSYKKLIEKKIK